MTEIEYQPTDEALALRAEMFSLMTIPHASSSPAEAYAQLEQIARRLGLTVVVSDNEANNILNYPYGWNGQVFRVNECQRKVIDLAHDLGHWIVASPARRSLPEFGLGPGFSTMLSAPTSMAVSDNMALFEEYAACLMAAILLDAVGMDTLDESDNVAFIQTIDGQPMWNSQEIERSVDFILPLFIDWGIIDRECCWTGGYRTTTIDPEIPFKLQ